MKCGLCGHEFIEQDAICNPDCPVGGGCSVVCCPRCGYGTPAESNSTLVRLARKARDVVGRRLGKGEVDAEA